MLGRPILLALALSTSLVACGESEEDRAARIRRSIEAETAAMQRELDVHVAMEQARITAGGGLWMAILAIDAEIDRRSDDFWNWPAHSDAERARINGGITHLRQVRAEIAAAAHGVR